MAHNEQMLLTTWNQAGDLLREAEIELRRSSTPKALDIAERIIRLLQTMRPQ